MFCASAPHSRRVRATKAYLYSYGHADTPLLHGHVVVCQCSAQRNRRVASRRVVLRSNSPQPRYDTQRTPPLSTARRRPHTPLKLSPRNSFARLRGIDVIFGSAAKLFLFAKTWLVRLESTYCCSDVLRAAIPYSSLRGKCFQNVGNRIGRNSLHTL